MAHALEQQAKVSVSAIDHRLRTTIAEKDEKANVAFARLREQLQHEATQSLGQRDQQIVALKRQLQDVQDASEERERLHAAKLATQLDATSAQAAERERHLTAEFRDTMLRVQSEASRKDNEAQAIVSAMLRVQQENTERLLHNHASTTNTVVAGLVEKIEANLTTRDHSIALLASSQKAQADIAAATAAAQESFMRQMQSILDTAPRVRIASGSGGDEPPRNPRGSCSWADMSGNDNPAPRATSLRRYVSRIPRDPDPDPDDSGDDDADDDDDRDEEDDNELGTLIPTNGTTKPTRAIMRARLTLPAPVVKTHLTEVMTTTTTETTIRIMIRTVVTPPILCDWGVATLFVPRKLRRRSQLRSQLFPNPSSSARGRHP